MKRSLLSSFWFWFFSAITIYTVYDYYKHLSYPDEPVFRDHAFQWLIFSIASVATIFLIIYGTHRLLQKWSFTRHWLFDGLGVGLALIVHITLTGPLWDHLFWSPSSLNFRFNIQGVLILLGIFYGVRLVFYSLVERKRSHAESGMDNEG